MALHNTLLTIDTKLQLHSNNNRNRNSGVVIAVVAVAVAVAATATATRRIGLNENAINTLQSNAMSGKSWNGRYLSPESSALSRINSNSSFLSLSLKTL